MKRCNWNILFLITPLVICFVWIFFSYNYPRNYFAAPIHSIVTIALGLTVSYYLVQKKTDTHKRYELAEKLLEQTKGKILELSTLLNDEKITSGRILGVKRAISNKLDNCKNISCKKSFDEKLESCIKEVKDLDNTLYDVHPAGDRLDHNDINSILRVLRNLEYHCDRALVDLWENRSS